jgi:phosphonoacetaldehyde hydrolase
MGLHKRDHIAAIAAMPPVAEAWTAAKGRGCGAEDVDRMYAEFIPLQTKVLPDYCELISGTLSALSALDERKIRVAATTGYNRPMMEVVLDGVREQGFEPEAAVCAEDVRGGRPAPWMIWRCLEQLDVFPPAAAVKVGDTLPDLEAGLNAGVWTVGVTRTGNMLGLSQQAVEALDEADLRQRLDSAREAMVRTGAHYVIEGVGDLPALLAEIERRRASGDRP